MKRSTAIAVALVVAALGAAALLFWLRPSLGPDDVAVAISYRAVGNTPLAVDSSAGVLARLGSDLAGAGLSWDPATALGGSVQGQSDGGFVYTPPAGARDVRDRFQVRIGESAHAVEIQIGTPVWYVDNSRAAGDGRRDSPFNRLRRAEEASRPGDWIYIGVGDGTSSGMDEGIRLKEGQRLIGQGSELAVDETVLASAGPVPEIASAGGSAVRLADGNRVAGLRIRAVEDGLLGEAITATELEDLEVVAGGAAVSLTACRGTLALRRLTLSGAAGLRLERNEGEIQASDIVYR